MLCRGERPVVLGLLYVAAAVQVMQEQGSGHLVNISSVAGRKIGPLRGAYPGTQFAVNAISEALRQELIEYNVRVTVVGPGAVETELPDHIADEEAREGIQSVYGLDTTLQPEDIANAIAYCVIQPERVSANEILIRSTQQGNWCFSRSARQTLGVREVVRSEDRLDESESNRRQA